MFLWSSAHHRIHEGTSMCDRVLHPPAMGGRWLRSDIRVPHSRGVSHHSDLLPKEVPLAPPQDSGRCRTPCRLHTSLHSDRADSHIHQCSLHTAHLGVDHTNGYIRLWITSGISNMQPMLLSSYHKVETHLEIQQRMYRCSH